MTQISYFNSSINGPVKNNIKSFIINLVFVSVAVFSVVENVTARGNQSQTVFSAPVKSDEEATVQHAEPALNLGTFKIPSSNGRITFLDETPSAKTPSISVVIVEDAGFNTLSEAAINRTSVLELFLAFAPPKTEIPERIKLAEDARDGRDTRDEPLKQPTSHLQFGGTQPLPIVEQDDWGSDCNDVDAWTDGFTSWVIGTAENNFQYPSYQTTDSVLVGQGQEAYGFFGVEDEIWAGVCFITSAGGVDGEIAVQMKFLNENGFWESVGGGFSLLPTKETLYPGERYLYHSFKPFTGQRGVFVYGQFGASFVIISGAWRDNFAPDNTFFNPYDP